MTSDRTTESTPTPSAGRVLVDALAQHGVERVFCVPGESYLEVLDALHDAHGIEVVVTKHEGGAANMAEADGKLTGRPGICMVTRGPGATHASIGLHVAQQDSTPMILFVGQIARGDRYRDVFQEMDYRQVFGTVAKLVIEIEQPERMAELVARAFHVATSGRPGPVVVALPEDMLTEAAPIPACHATPVAEAAVAADTAAQLQELLAQAQRPLLVVGGSSTLWSHEAYALLRERAAAWQLPVACAFRRQDIFDNRHPQYVGHLSLGMAPSVRGMLEQADLVIAIGTRLSDITTGEFSLLSVPRPAQKLVHCHPSDEELGRLYQADLAIAAKPEAVLRALADKPAAAVPWADWCAQGRAGYERFTSRPEQADKSADKPAEKPAGVDMRDVMLHLNDALPEDAILTNGAGNYAIWLHRFFRYRTPRTELAPTCGAMGYGLPAAVAAALRHKDRPVVCFAGDGCFMMYPQELATAAEFGAALIVIVVNNGMYGTIRMHQEKRYPGRVSATRLRGPDYVALGQAFGAHAERVQNAADFPAAFERALQAQRQGGMALLELVTDPRQITPDMRLAD